MWEEWSFKQNHRLLFKFDLQLISKNMKRPSVAYTFLEQREREVIERKWGIADGWMAFANALLSDRMCGRNNPAGSPEKEYRNSSGMWRN